MSILMMALGSTLSATPATVERVIEDAPPGAVIVLAPGDYGKIRIQGKTWSEPVTLNMTDARATLEIGNAQGVRVVGGTFGLVSQGYAIHVLNSRDIGFENVKMTSAQRGLVIAQSQDVSVSHARIVNMTIDGINIGSSQRVTVTDSSCSDFRTGKAHPDCIQMWSSPTRGITQDVKLLRNSSDGDMQGFTAFNHVRKGVDDGGFDRITIADNRVRAYRVNGVAVYDCRNCVIVNNVAETPKDAKRHVVIRVFRCTDCTVKGNVNGRRP
ncbi:right-handed parallel beta-helix repeat-containing protein [Novosphingobium mangrovi (ex Huang et al. 2023)]|uniref:Right-handed parallel beta-helix repeat-containing protein n=1 Tax=Novosphingobium mangrovi (ex Huang et al. 2023) TaxID=2976432 RepID=A0ABT2I0R5_9SPHN|nr:right-handed parallel beta-helix repeat-containing protein [Novosphingobium mangrovi (ex Huang et al. 2023)]MCT2398388.1 right-handed parallel beta-helix repeat-containing protein [Novosphingobium mangrovi (ex Huang et al. 2023)]